TSPSARTVVKSPMWAVVVLVTLSTPTAPPTPTKPPAIPKPIMTKSSLAPAATITSFLAVTCAELPISAVVVLVTTFTPTLGPTSGPTATPPPPTPPDTDRWYTPSPAPTSTFWPDPAPPCEILTFALSPIDASVVALTTSTPADTPTATPPPANARVKVRIS